MTPSEALDKCLSKGTSLSVLTPLTFRPARSSSPISALNSEHRLANEPNSGKAATSEGSSQGVKSGIIFSAIFKKPFEFGGFI